MSKAQCYTHTHTHTHEHIHTKVKWLEQANDKNPYADPWYFENESGTKMGLGILNCKVEMLRSRHKSNPHYTIAANSSRLCTYWAERWETDHIHVNLHDDERPLRG